MRAVKQLKVLALWVLLGNLAGIAGAIWIELDGGNALVASLHAHAEGFAATAASFAFSMLGFLAAGLSVFGLLGQTRAFRIYRQDGYLSLLLLAASFAMLELGVAFVAALRLFFEPLTQGKIEFALIALIAAGGMLALCIIPVVGLLVRTANESD